jgi:hypothetical protein
MLAVVLMLPLFIIGHGQPNQCTLHHERLQPIHNLGPDKFFEEIVDLLWWPFDKGIKCVVCNTRFCERIK